MTTQSKRLEGHQLKCGPEQRPAHVVGGAPHGFGVWIDGEFRFVDIGALGTVIVKLTEELEAARKELVEQRQAYRAELRERLQRPQLGHLYGQPRGL
jgi:hypothetical protein